MTSPEPGQKSHNPIISTIQQENQIRHWQNSHNILFLSQAYSHNIQYICTYFINYKHIELRETTIFIEYLNHLVGSARKVIILSWGHPGQAGEGHVNGRTKKAVEQKMKERGWKKNEIHTERLQLAATAPWIKSNVQVFDKAP